MIATRPAAAPIPVLSREHRTWIALYCLQSNFPDRQQVLVQNDVTEDDLRQYTPGWLLLRHRHQLRRR
ncbi:hypothetical protein KLP40_13605 [Hymenobacter sp. NST-14]|uniref:hypothetical protein n=1 Tax=Hymenobacter piscis TaxID=2839984 RepID=UPI001C013945|nr:hypothetical protein [Hymenobacter piscis]MBT9394203.1 hypothetical protein [Hymenobacter piscis]